MISHVCEIRLYNLSDEESLVAQKGLRECLQVFGYLSPASYEVIVINANIKFQWKPPQNDDVPSDPQKYYVRKLYNELKALANGNSDLQRRAQQLLRDVESEMQSNSATKSNISNIINCLKEAIADLEFERTGQNVCKS